ncbi:hypothetical protein [Spirosoma pollinicola]|uniref:Uncharacterized protein n=1 Tax=Spirosoma pollinicola TaxID=2057025 RepID=A0A2K8Z476_9BACT|nr:hypothetical protein [Spirosoma pollinicola]AUD04651.1 hypothetical protein CWM47_24055 [Spirosoma pollinicola]
MKPEASESIQKDIMGASRLYVHPYFRHDEQGNLESVDEFAQDMLNYFEPDSYRPHVVHTIAGPLTEKHVNDNIVQALNWLGSGYKLDTFLDRHFGPFYGTLMGDQSAQPFFDFLVAILSSQKAEFRKYTYDAVWGWIRLHKDYFLGIPLDVPSLPTGSLILKKDICLFYIYQGMAYDKEKIKELAPQLGFNSPTSGSQLADDFFALNTAEKRTDVEGRAIKDRIRKIQKVMSFLPDECKSLAQADLETLQRKL